MTDTLGNRLQNHFSKADPADLGKRYSDFLIKNPQEVKAFSHDPVGYVKAANEWLSDADAQATARRIIQEVTHRAPDTWRYTDVAWEDMVAQLQQPKGGVENLSETASPGQPAGKVEARPGTSGSGPDTGTRYRTEDQPVNIYKPGQYSDIGATGGYQGNPGFGVHGQGPQVYDRPTDPRRSFMSGDPQSRGVSESEARAFAYDSRADLNTRTARTPTGVARTTYKNIGKAKAEDWIPAKGLNLLKNLNVPPSRVDYKGTPESNPIFGWQEVVEGVHPSEIGRGRGINRNKAGRILAVSKAMNGLRLSKEEEEEMETLMREEEDTYRRLRGHAQRLNEDEAGLRGIGTKVDDEITPGEVTAVSTGEGQPVPASTSNAQTRPYHTEELYDDEQITDATSPFGDDDEEAKRIMGSPQDNSLYDDEEESRARMLDEVARKAELRGNFAKRDKYRALAIEQRRLGMMKRGHTPRIFKVEKLVRYP